MACLFLLISALCLSNVLAKPTVRDEVQEEDYRLAQNFKIRNYNLELTVPEECFTAEDNEYTGTVTIAFSFTTKTEYITLHAHSDFIKIKKLTFNNIDLSSEGYSINNDTNILKIKLSNEITVDEEYKLIIEFTSHLSTRDMYGFYRSSYVEAENTRKYLATTQFQPVYARRAFPCFDEPSFKATFDVSIVHPSHLNIFFNTKAAVTIPDEPAGTTTTTFETTPVMSTYLVAFIISEFTCTAGEAVDDVAFQVCSRDESKDTRALAVEVGSKIIEKLNAYTGYNYGNDIKKMDQVAIPDLSGAMENWGLATYRESALLWNEKESSNRDNQRITKVIAHELSHQWFGNLVTCNWWSETFLNEGFASYFEYYITNEIKTDWELDKQFVIEEVHSVLAADATVAGSQALQSDASTPTEIVGKFGTISYNKVLKEIDNVRDSFLTIESALPKAEGCYQATCLRNLTKDHETFVNVRRIFGRSVVRMIAHFLGMDNFKIGVQKYVVDHAHSTVQPEDVWKSLDGISKNELPADDLATVMENWVKNPGFPLVTVKLQDDNKLSISQERFLYSDTDKNSKWYVPISLTTSLDEKKFESTDPTDWLTPTEDKTVDLSKDAAWVVVNNQQTGYYRVNYDDALWNKIKTALESETFGGIEDLNRAQIIDDLFNLARANKVKYSLALDIASYLSKDTSYYSWYAAFNGYDFLLKRAGDDKLEEAISSTLLEHLDALYKSVPFSTVNADDQIYTHKQVLALSWACKLGNEDCVKEANKQFQEYKETGTKPDRNLKTVVYCNGLRYSTDNTDWEFLWNAYLDASGLSIEQLTILSALGCTKDTDLLKDFLTKAITKDSGIKSQDVVSVFSAVYSNPLGVDVAFSFLKENQEAISDYYQQGWIPMGSLLINIAANFKTEAQLEELKNFVNGPDILEDLVAAGNTAIATAQANVEWLKTNKEDLYQYYELKVGTTTDGSTSESSDSSPSDSTEESTSTVEGPRTTPSGAVSASSSLLLTVVVAVMNKKYFN